jgi:hypothetical protein
VAFAPNHKKSEKLLVAIAGRDGTPRMPRIGPQSAGSPATKG